MPTTLRKLMPVAVLLIALAAILTACGDSEDEPSETTTESEATSEPAGLDPAAVEASVQEFLETDEYAADLSPTVDCGEESGETLDCTISGDKNLTGAVGAAPSQGFQYTGEIEGPEGPSSLGGSTSDGSVTVPASVEQSLNETLSDEAGEPTAECPDAPEGDSLECEVTGDGVTGTLTATPIGGFEWEGQIETPDGARGISGNALPE
ncbi:MAG TPA: hypothetical protein VD766_10775 [Solirubrobacterales bacterium]|nr:hypothetical protein [Solirubrobacterales bacterium]